MLFSARPARFAAVLVAVAVGAAGTGTPPAAASAPPTGGTAVLDAPQPGTGAVTGRVSATDPDGDPLTFTGPPVTAKGALSVAPDGAFVYTPGAAAREAAAAGPAEATDTFVVTVSDGTGGFLDVPVSIPITPATARVAAGGVRFDFSYGIGSELWTPEARSALESAAAALAAVIVVDQPVSITVAVIGTDTPGAPNIAASWVGFSSDDPGFYPTVVQNKILNGVDPNGEAPDAQITTNFAEAWSFGEAVAGDRYDFRTVVIHEFTHTLGFLSGMGDPTDDRNWTTYDSFLRSADGAAVIDDAHGFKPEFLPNLTGGNGGLFFAGPNAVAAFGGPVPLFTPEVWASASRSVSHVNALPGYLMDPFYGYGPGVRVLSPVEIAILRDLGYRVR